MSIKYISGLCIFMNMVHVGSHKKRSKLPHFGNITNKGRFPEFFPELMGTSIEIIAESVDKEKELWTLHSIYIQQHHTVKQFPDIVFIKVLLIVARASGYYFRKDFKLPKAVCKDWLVYWDFNIFIKVCTVYLIIPNSFLKKIKFYIQECVFTPNISFVCSCSLK